VPEATESGGLESQEVQRGRRAREPGGRRPVRHEPLHTTGVTKKRFLGTQAPKREARSKAEEKQEKTKRDSECVARRPGETKRKRRMEPEPTVESTGTLKKLSTARRDRDEEGNAKRKIITS
jgi:hypothetical protein